MLQEIYINNFVLIDELRIEFNAGLNVLSGETGAGKSIIIDALSLIMGERVKNDWIRDNSRKAIAEAVFILSPGSEAQLFLIENTLVEEGENTLIISREIYPGGRSTARINRRSVTAGLLRELAALLLDMHLQHEHLSILKSEKYIDYLDNFAGGAEKLLTEIETIFKQIREKQERLKTIERGQQDKEERMETLGYQIQEIESADIREGEEKELRARQARIKNAGRLLEGSGRILDLLYSGESGKNAYDLISAARDAINNLKEEKTFAELGVTIEEIYYSLQDIASKLTAFRETLDFQPGELEELEDRLYLISKLQKKYGDSVSEVLDYLESARGELERLGRRQETIEETQGFITELQRTYQLKAAALSKIRVQAAKKMEAKVHDELIQLNMPHVRFIVNLQPRAVPGPKGMDQIDFLFSPNPGEPPGSLSRVASGGELSRFVLALKTVLAGVYKAPTMIFDEIDVGVGGSALKAMARKLYQLAASHQVILVTHSAQVASFADTHYLITKRVENGTTVITGKALDKKGREQEIARMLSGDNFSPLTLEHAREMLNQAHNL